MRVALSDDRRRLILESLTAFYSEAFDEEDPDWPCEEVWEPEPRGIDIPVAYSGDTWEACLATLKALVLKQLETDSPAARKRPAACKSLRCSRWRRARRSWSSRTS